MLCFSDFFSFPFAAICGGPLTDVYRIAQYHFHWGECDQWGSEHAVDGHYYASELHCVFWNTRYAGIGEAVEKPDGLAVLGTLIEVRSRRDLSSFCF